MYDSGHAVNAPTNKQSLRAMVDNKNLLLLVRGKYCNKHDHNHIKVGGTKRSILSELSLREICFAMERKKTKRGQQKNKCQFDMRPLLCTAT
jgi:hypothetical protein